jgi:hypothetical protein
LFVLCEIYCVAPSTALVARYGTLNFLPFCQKNKNCLSLHADITNKMLEKSYSENSVGITQYYNYSDLCTLCGSRISVIPFHWNWENPRILLWFFPYFQCKVSICNVSHIMRITFWKAIFCFKEFMTGKNVKMLRLLHFPTYFLLSSSYFEIRKTNIKVLSWIQIIIRKSNTKEILIFFPKLETRWKVCTFRN